MALLEVDGLVKYYGRRPVVDRVSFNVAAGEVVGLLGPNGAGKTTSFRMATGQITPNAGKVIFNGQDVTPLPMFRRARLGMGYLSQEPSVFRKLTVEKNLLAILEALPRSRSLGRKLSRTERWARTNDALTRFKLDLVRKNSASRCSGGEKRRLEIARCLVCEPLLILLDEPFAAVDPITTEDIRTIIRDLARSGIGILITDHNVREVFRSADRVYLISQGKVVTHGTPHELVNDQKAIDAYLGRSFEEDGFTRQMASRAQPTRSIETVSVPAAVANHAAPAQTRQTPAQPSISQSPPAAPVYERSTANSQPQPQAPSGRPASQPTAAPSVTPPPANLPKMAPSPFPSVTPVPSGAFTGVVGGMLEMEILRRAVEQLVDPEVERSTSAAKQLVSKGLPAIGVLLDALERREPDLRRRAFEVLRFLTKEFEPLKFDPDAADEVRLRQVAYLRVKIARQID